MPTDFSPAPPHFPHLKITAVLPFKAYDLDV